MASAFSSTPPDLRIVLLGKAGAGKSKVARALLGGKGHKGESGTCVLREGEAAGKSICVVDTPGWDRVAIHRTTDKIKKEIDKSVTLCPPGPHALILVLPVTSLDEVPSVKELKTASQHMELLSNRVWNHTIVLFCCDENVEESVISKHIKSAGKLLEKCDGRHYVLRNVDSETQIHGLLKEIEDMVEKNCDDFFLPQIYNEVMQSRTPQDVTELKRMYEEREKQLKQTLQKRLSAYKTEAEQEATLRQRRGSSGGTRPNMNEEAQGVDIAAIKKKYREEMLTLVRYYLKPAVVVVLAFLGALIGSVVGSAFGVVGSGVGIVIGILVTLPISLWLIDAARLARDNTDVLAAK